MAENIIYSILTSIIKAVSERTVNRAYDYMEKTKSHRGENEENTEKYIIGDEYYRLTKYIVDSLGGYENIVLAGNYGDGYKFLFNDLSKVKYEHMKNFDFRVFISEERDSMILIPQITSKQSQPE